MPYRKVLGGVRSPVWGYWKESGVPYNEVLGRSPVVGLLEGESEVLYREVFGGVRSSVLGLLGGRRGVPCREVSQGIEEPCMGLLGVGSRAPYREVFGGVRRPLVGLLGGEWGAL